MSNYPDGMTKEHWTHIDGESHYPDCPKHEDYAMEHLCPQVEWNYDTSRWELVISYYPRFGRTRITYCPHCGEELPFKSCHCERIKEEMK